MDETEDDVVPIRSPTERDADFSDKLQCDGDAYTVHVIERLIGVFGKNKSAVVSYIIRNWIQEHRDELRSMGIDLQVDGGELIVRNQSTSE